MIPNLVVYGRILLSGFSPGQNHKLYDPSNLFHRLQLASEDPILPLSRVSICSEGQKAKPVQPIWADFSKFRIKRLRIFPAMRGLYAPVGPCDRARRASDAGG